jgi:hypothetical protein
MALSRDTAHTSPATDEDAAQDADGSAAPDADASFPDTPTELAQELLVACKSGTATDPYEQALATLDDDALASIREERERALAFWINCYNAGTQLLLDRRPDLYESPLRFVRFFHAPVVTVAGTDLPLDRIENGLLRGGRSKYGLGYLPKVLVTSFERRYALETCDPRIHFALNCGAASCPPVAAYTPDTVEETLEAVTGSYLDRTVAFEPGGWLWDGTARVSRLFLWYRGDFGGKSGIVAFLRRYDQLPAGVRPRLSHRPYDWSLKLGQYAGEFES